MHTFKYLVSKQFGKFERSWKIDESTSTRNVLPPKPFYDRFAFRPLARPVNNSELGFPNTRSRWEGGHPYAYDDGDHNHNVIIIFVIIIVS